MESNPYILLLGPEQGGHVAFISSNSSPSHRADDNGSSRFAGTSSDQSAEDDLRFAIRASGSEDRFWAETRVVEFCRNGECGVAAIAMLRLERTLSQYCKNVILK